MMFKELLEKSRELWLKKVAQRPDLNARTLREDAILEIVCQLIAEVAPPLEERMFQKRNAKALAFLEPYVLRVVEIPPEHLHDLVLKVQKILNGELA